MLRGSSHDATRLSRSSSMFGAVGLGKQGRVGSRRRVCYKICVELSGVARGKSRQGVKQPCHLDNPRRPHGDHTLSFESSGGAAASGQSCYFSFHQSRPVTLLLLDSKHFLHPAEAVAPHPGKPRRHSGPVFAPFCYTCRLALDGPAAVWGPWHCLASASVRSSLFPLGRWYRVCDYLMRWADCHW